jgi:hypothetical protein
MQRPLRQGPPVGQHRRQTKCDAGPDVHKASVLGHRLFFSMKLMLLPTISSLSTHEQIYMSTLKINKYCISNAYQECIHHLVSSDQYCCVIGSLHRSHRFWIVESCSLYMGTSDIWTWYPALDLCIHSLDVFCPINFINTKFIVHHDRLHDYVAFNCLSSVQDHHTIYGWNLKSMCDRQFVHRDAPCNNSRFDLVDATCPVFKMTSSVCHVASYSWIEGFGFKFKQSPFLHSTRSHIPTSLSDTNLGYGNNPLCFYQKL